MDKIKTQLAFVLKYGFWISCGIVFLGSLGVWFMTTRQLASEAAEQTQEIEGAIATVSSTKAELPTLPNEYSHTQMRKLIEDRQDEVLNSWSMLYDRQRSILTWPVEELKQDFVDEFKDLIPIEAYVDFPTLPQDEKETTLLRRYEDYIKNILPDIAVLGGCEWTAEFNQSASMGGMMGMMDEMGEYGMSGAAASKVDITGAAEGPLVIWGSSSQGQVLTDLFPWRGKTPSTLEVYYSQENIWILRQLLKIVADVNGEATQPYQAKIREIHRIGIGDSVDFEAGQITDPGTRRSGMGGMMGMDMDMEMEVEFEMDYSAGESGTAVTLDPADNRYVDVSLKPITGAALRTALKSNSPNDASLAVAKRVPVMLAFDMDQRAVPELVAACGSAALMVDVIQVRVLPKGASGGGGGMLGEMEEDGGGMEMEMEMMMGGGMGMGPSMAASTEPVDEYPLDMSVEIYGIIHIYNPPDREALGVDQVTEDTKIDGSGETIGEQKDPESVAPVEGELPTPQADAPATAPETPAAPPTAMVPVSQP